MEGGDFMDFIFEVIMEFIIEIFGEVYVEVATSLMPNKVLSKRAQNALSVIFALIGVAFFLLFIVGIILLIARKGASTLGWIFFGVSLAFLIISIVLKYISSKK